MGESGKQKEEGVSLIDDTLALYFFFALQLGMQHVIFLHVPSMSLEDVLLHPQVSHFGKEAFSCVKETREEENKQQQLPSSVFCKTTLI